MVGRRRRAPSDSTVATIDENTIQFHTEDSVLKPVSTRVHPDDWPCFLLADATVYHKDGTLANLLHVDLEGPLIVRGRVEIEKDQEKYLTNKQIKGQSPWIQIQNTLSFSIGLKDDGLPMPVLWASGRAGWFEIVPSDTYKDICDTMFQGISLHYCILDAYEAGLEALQKKHKKKTLDDVRLREEIFLFQYAVTIGDGVTLPEAVQRIKDQAIFLLSHFPKDTEFHRWLTKKFPDVVKKLAAKESNDSKTTSMPDSGPLVAVPYQPLEKSSSLEVTDGRGKVSSRNSALKTMRSSEAVSPGVTDLSSDERGKGRGKGKQTRSRQKASRNSDITMLDAPGDMPRGSDNASNSRTERNEPLIPIKNDVPQLSSQETRTGNIGVPPDAKSSLSTVLNALRDTRQDMIEGKRGKHPDDVSSKSWFTKLYLELSIRNPKALAEICEYFASDLVQLLGSEWHSSRFYQWAKENVNTKPKFEFITEEDMKQIVRRKKKGRPSREEVTTPTQDPESTKRTGGKQPPHRGRPSGKVGGLRLSTGGKKRLRHEASDADEMDIDEDGMPINTSKRSRYFDDDEQDKQDEDVDETTSLASDEEEVEDEDNVPLTRVAIHTEKLPSTTPRGPNQTWTCEEPDCGYIVRAADQEDGQALINEHYEAHEKEAQEEAEQAALDQSSLENLAVQESQRGHMPINHLLAKIRSIGDKAQKRGETRLNGQVVPQPIKRSLLV